MIKRTESKPPSTNRRKRSDRAKRRRLMMEGLEQRQLLAGGGLPLVPVDVPDFTGPRNVGSVQSFAFVETELTNEAGLNDTIFTADVVPLGNMPGQENTIDLTGNMSFTASSATIPSFTTDLDYFAFDLKAGDILDISAQGSAGEYSVLFEDGSLWFGVDDVQAFFYPADSPLQTSGNSVFAQVIPEDGRYYLSVAPITTDGNYTIGLRTYRPVVESLPIGTQQVIFVDMDGAIYPRSVFDDGSGVPQPGVVRLPSLRESLPLIGIEELDDASFDRLVDLTLLATERMFGTLVSNGSNGDYDSTGIPGDYAVTILNSRDHADPGNNELVTRMLLGGSVDDVGVNTIGLSSTIDVGNFSMDDLVFGVLDSVEGLITSIPIANTRSVLDATAEFLAFLISHEVGHSFGMRHTTSENTITNVMDEGPGADFAQVIGAGNDGIYGTIDDTPTEFVRDRFSLNEGLIGFNHTAGSLSNTLATGTGGGGVSGVVFNDFNRDGQIGLNDLGIGGVTVFADTNGNGALDGFEPRTVTQADGSYSLSATPGTFNIIAIAPERFVGSTPAALSTVIGLGGGTPDVNFGFTQVTLDITGTKFSDNDGDGLFDPGEPGLAGVYIYLDLDGDNRPDLGEPSTLSGSDGSYSINFPGPGTYTIREVVEPGFIQTFPVSGEHTVVFDGTALTDNFNFGNLPSRDFGDAPDTYSTLTASGGANHGITAGLTIGAVVDRDLDGRPTIAANGDDINGRVNFDGSIQDDEDGVRLLSPLGPGDSASFEVIVNNTSGSPAFLQGFIDLDGDGTFAGLGEKFVSDRVVSSGTVGARLILDVDVPADAPVGQTYVRFRLAQESGLSFGGFTVTGEVEDHAFPILTAANVANNDEFSVSRNTQANQLDVLANDFQTVDNQLTIVRRDLTTTSGTVVIAGDGKSVFYTPPNGFIGRDVFGYTVRDQFGQESDAVVVVNVTFQSAIPIAVDDTFDIPEGSVNRALNVLDNDVPSTSGGLTITSVTPGSAGGTISIIGGGQSLRYTPLPGFNGTELFTYSVQDSAGITSTANVTLNLLPGSRADDIVEFSFGIFDVVNDRPITNVQVGDRFNVRIFVDDLRNLSFGDPEGVASAFLDFLYTDELVATLDTDNDPSFPFDVSFGPFFTGAGTFQQGNSLIPGLLDELGGLQPIGNQMQHTGPVELLTVTLQAVSSGVAVFAADPADNVTSETTTIGSDVALEPRQLRLGRTELLIVPASGDFTSAIDDSFPLGTDSDGNIITGFSASPNRLDVLANDNLGPTGVIREFGLITAPAFGNVEINDAGTPTDFNDDFFDYRADVNANGFDRFSYVIVTADGIRSTAEVTLAIGNAGANDIVAIDFRVVNSSGIAIDPVTDISVGDRFGVEIILDDLRAPIDATFVFAGFLDVLYDAGILLPSNQIAGDGFNFDVVFGPNFNVNTAVGTAARLGVIDEFGTQYEQGAVPTNDPNSIDPLLMATLFFTAQTTGTTTIAGGPADSSPFQDTLLFLEDEPVPVDQIRYDAIRITVNGGPEGEFPQQNTTLPPDVNNDGDVTPLDALHVINELSRAQLAGFRAEGESVSVSRYYTDVNGDKNTTAVDALRVINYMSQRNLASSLEAESEAAVQLDSDTTTDESNSIEAADVAFADLHDKDLIVDASAGSRIEVQSIVQESNNSASSDDDDDDTLNLLADDISGL